MKISRNVSQTAIIAAIAVSTLLITFGSAKSLFADAYPRTPQSAALQINGLRDEHDLSSFHSQNDFNQKPFTEIQAEAEIQNRVVQAAQNGVTNAEIEIPFNEKKLEYLNFRHPNETRIFGGNPVSATNSSTINKILYIYRYNNIYISTETDTLADHENVYYVLRAINLLRYRYPKAWERLFVQTSANVSDRPAFAPFANSNKAVWIAFNETPESIAASYTSFVSDGMIPDAESSTVTRSRNIPIINLHARTIRGSDPKNGSKPLYQKASSEENYRLYMRDGLVETLVHEMLHRYIDYRYTADAQYNVIHAARDLPRFIDAEECAIMNTSLSYFLREGGLSDAVPAYYLKTVFRDNIKKMKDAGTLTNYASKFSGETSLPPSSPADLRKAFFLSALD